MPIGTLMTNVLKTQVTRGWKWRQMTTMICIGKLMWPHNQQTQIEEKSLNNSILTVKTAVTQKKMAVKSAMKTLSLMSMTTGSTVPGKSTDAQMVTSQTLAKSQLTEQVSQIKMENKQIMENFDRLADQMEAFFNNQTTTSH